MSIEVRLLGRFAVLRDGEEIPPAAFRQRLVRTLVRILVVRRGEFVSRDVISEALWPGEAPADPAANLRVLVTLARKALGDASLIRGGAGGYALSAGDWCVVDAELFEEEFRRAEQALASGDHRQALEGFRSALQLWHGEPLPEDAFDDWAAGYRSRLLRTRLHALEGAASASLSLGEPVPAVGWAEQAASAEPLRERAHALLVESLAVSGDTARALAEYEEFRRRLAGELGLDPSPEIQQLQARALRGEIAAHAGSDPLPLPAELSGGSPGPFVGRSAELDRATGFVTSRAGARLGVVWITGEPGIGKTRLAAEVARAVHRAGGLVLFGRCTEELDIPYQPFMEALNWYVARFPDPQLGRRLGSTPWELARLVPAIGTRIAEAPAGGTAGPQIEQHRLFEAVRSWLASAGGEAPAVLVIDDIQWAAHPTLALLSHIARSAEPSNAVLICTARSGPSGEDGAQSGLMEELGRRGTPALKMPLGGLTVDAVAELAASGGPVPEGRLASVAAELQSETAGNPLYVESLLKVMSSDPESRPLAARSLSDIVLSRVNELPPEVAVVLDTASVAGERFDLRVVAGAAGGGELPALEAVEAAVRTGLLEEEGPDRFRFRHALVRAVLQQRLSRSRRVRLHLRVGEAMEQVHSRQLEHHVDALAHHFFEALPAGGAPKALRYTVMLAEQATRLLSHEQAVEAYDRALELVERVSDPNGPSRYDILTARSEAQRSAGDMLGALGTLEAAARDAESQGDARQLAQAAVSYEATTFWLGTPEEDAAGLLAAAEASLSTEDSALRALVLASLGRALTNTGRPAGTQRGDEALSMARRLGDPGTEFQVELRTTPSSVSVAQAEASAARWTALYEKARELGDTDAYLLGLGQTIWARLMLGDPARRQFSEYSRLALQLRQPKWEAWLDVLRALRMLLDGDLAAAEQLLRRAEHIAESFGWARQGLFGLAMFQIRREQGRLGEVAPLLQASVRSGLDGGLWRPGLAVLLVELGRLEEARNEYEAELRAMDAHGEADELTLALVAESCAALGDASRAPELVERLLPCKGKLLVFLLSAVCLGPADRLLGMMASTAGMPDEAERWHSSGLALARRLDSPLWTARCLYDFAVHLGNLDRPRADAMLAEAAGICAHTGLEGLGNRVNAARTAR